MSKSLKPPGPAYCDMREAAEAIPAMDGQWSLMSSDILHELPTDDPQVHT